MFFLLSKVLWFVIQPSHVVVWLALATAILLFLNHVRPARWLGAATAGLLLLLGCSPLGYWMLQGLENGYSRPVDLPPVDGILILGGGNDTAVLQSRHVYGQDRAMARLVSAYVLARRYPLAKVVFSGGSGELNDQTISESIAAQNILLALGLSPSRLTLEGKSRNTWENFVFSKQLVRPKPGETWVLATSAFHMPRAMRIAKKAGWPMLPWPTDYRTTTKLHYHFEDVIGNFDMTDTALREYIGIWAYRASGKAT
ncbi:MAG: YdcF family protein [Rhizomicrobium sp.]|nr:YdcF family protein [Rhizomicrobium sp.]